ncbi:DNA-binding transcriptional regulator, LacI/PurR family [Lentzea jiangxiensis]|uniref:DNA-binding transcriptional regulator, LacI/PurR family n=1 Tax=Lentzea jiangxiensis TaxID=641025 RepID=A0A1H0IP42_9PSEU|nr:LacI family DNA-binding transcriptional regulator [Lentzea jiangxiensis]SDO33122.1 DNA-binding transcriptional regulator, LacI/PurR family [Lentzea jiangxiensis]
MVTIVDVAKHAGVAPSTVSYVLTGKRAVSADTRVRVRESIQLLGYRPHGNALAPMHRRTNVLALVLPLREGVHLPVVMRFVTSVVTAARAHDMNVLLVTADQGAAGLRALAGGGRVDGFLVMDVELDDERVPALRELGRPSVLLGHPTALKGLTCVDLDFEAAGARCVDHLADLGHRSIGFLGAPSIVYERNTGFAQRTLAGFGAAAMRRGVASTALPAEQRHDSVLSVVSTLLRELPRMSALVVQNEAVLGQVVDCLRASGKRVPEDVAVVAICPDELAERLRLTSVQLPVEALGRRAVDLLMAKLNGRQPPALTLLPPKLACRSAQRGAPVLRVAE